MPTLFKKAQLRHEKEEREAKKRTMEENVAHGKSTAYLRNIKSLTSELHELSLKLEGHTAATTLKISLKEYVQDIVDTMPLPYSDNARTNFAQLRMNFAKEFISEINNCLDNADREIHRSFFTKEMQPFNIPCSDSDRLTNNFTIQKRNDSLHAMGSTLFGFGVIFHVVGFMSFCISLILAFCLVCSPLAPAISLLIGGLGMIGEKEGERLLKSAEEKRMPDETNQQVLERDKDERSELMDYAKELFFHANEASIDGEKTTDISTSNSFA